MDNVTIKDIKEHHRRTHTLNNMRFVIAGKMAGRKTAIKDFLEQWQLESGERFAIPRDERNQWDTLLFNVNPILLKV